MLELDGAAQTQMRRQVQDEVSRNTIHANVTAVMLGALRDGTVRKP